MPLALVTGGTGFIGSALLTTLHAAGWQLRAVVRRIPEKSPLPVYWRKIEDIGSSTSWSGVLEGVDCVVHLAARVHMLKETSREPYTAFRHVNVTGTERLARACVDAGVRRFIYLSSAGVHGARSLGQPLSEGSPLVPHDDYSASKLAAEEVLAEIGRDTSLEVVVLRPPLVYGRGAPGNFARLAWLVRRGWPLPFASIDNRRSLIYLGNLLDAIAQCMRHPAAAGQTFLVCDGRSLSTANLLRETAAALGIRAWLWKCPPEWLYRMARLVGRAKDGERLLNSLELDCSHIKRTLGWQPPYSTVQGLAATLAPERHGRV